jgi:hypothetical protein
MLSTEWMSEQTPLLYATAAGRTAIVKLLLEAGADINKTYKSGCTPLYEAIRSGHLEVAKLLIEHNADVDKPYRNSSPLHRAADKGYLEIVELLIEHNANIHKKGNNGETPLHIAACYGHLQIVKVLVDSGAVINQKDKNGIPILDAAINHYYRDVAIFLKQALSLQNNTGVTALNFSKSSVEPKEMSGVRVPLFNGKYVTQRKSDSFIYGTEICKAAGKQWNRYYQNKETKQFIELLEKQRANENSQLVPLFEVTPGKHADVWVCKEIAFHLACWCDREFEAQFITWAAAKLQQNSANTEAAITETIDQQKYNELMTELKAAEAEEQFFKAKQQLLKVKLQNTKL